MQQPIHVKQTGGEKYCNGRKRRHSFIVERFAIMCDLRMSEAPGFFLFFSFLTQCHLLECRYDSLGLE